MTRPFIGIKAPLGKLVGTFIDEVESNFSYMDSADSQIIKDAFGLTYAITGTGTNILGTALIDRDVFVGTNVLAGDVKENQPILEIATFPTMRVKRSGVIVNVLADSTSGDIPVGLISMFDGDIALAGINFDATGLGIDNLVGFALCNGNNTTPDLRDKFIAGAGGALSVGDTGGTDSQTNLPSHNHTIRASTNAADNTAPGAAGTDHFGSGELIYRSQIGGLSFNNLNPSTIGTTGVGGGTENRPQFHALGYIKKL